MITVTCSGAYSTGAGGSMDIVDFDDLKGTIPNCDESWVTSHVQNRYIPIWIKASKKYTKRLDLLRKCYIDNIKEDDKQPDIIGKNILSLTWEELQDLATYKHLLRIPLFQATSLRQARQQAYLEYHKEILGHIIDEKDDPKGYESQCRTLRIVLDPSDSKFNFAKLPELKVEGDDVSPAEHDDPEDATQLGNALEI